MRRVRERPRRRRSGTRAGTAACPCPITRQRRGRSRSATAVTRLRSWLAKSTPRPSSFSASSLPVSQRRPARLSRCSGSSSSVSTRGRAKQVASASRRRCPLDRPTGSWSAAPARPTSASRSAACSSGASSPCADISSARCSETARSAKNSTSSRTAATARRVWRSRSRIGRPHSRMDPADGRSFPATQRSSVLLPEPFGPTTATASPGRTSASTPQRTSTSPNERRSPLMASSGSDRPGAWRGRRDASTLGRRRHSQPGPFETMDLIFVFRGIRRPAGPKLAAPDVDRSHVARALMPS